MALNSSNFIQTLINSGPDASLNLFEVTFQPMQGNDMTTVKESFSCRITQLANLLQRDNITVDIGYQNISIPIISTGTSINRTLGFSIRLDDDYYIFSKLRELQSIDEFGNIIQNENKKVKITLKALKPLNTPSMSANNYFTVYQWEFFDCYITSVSAITYNYDSNTTATASVNFIWKHCTESKVNEEQFGITANNDIERGKQMTEYYKSQQAQSTANRDNERGKRLTEQLRARQNAYNDNERGKATTEYYKSQLGL